MIELRRRTAREGDDFRYSKIDSATREIRVVWIQPDLDNGLIKCQLKYVKIDSEHACLSYMWGSAKKIKQIRVNNQRFYVHGNLWKFLNSWRQHRKMQPMETQYIWIDEICIDQSNKEERNHQVGIMGEIYQSATEVLVWLGGGELDIEEALHMMNGMRLTGLNPLEFAKRVLGLRPSGIKSLKEAIAKISTLPYWDRLWIKQELILNQNVRFLYGRSQSKFLPDFLCECNGSDWCSDHPSYAAGSIPCTKTLSFCPWYPGSFSPYPLQNLISRFSGSACSTVHDRVYGLLAMADERNIFKIDYGISTAELFMQTLSIALLPRSSSLIDLEYVDVLVNCLHIFDSDLKNEELRRLQEKHAPDGWYFNMELDFFATFAKSQSRQTARRNTSPRFETDRMSDQLLNMIVDGLHEAESGIASNQEEASYEEMDPKDGISNPPLQRIVLAGDSGLLLRDVILRIASFPELSNLFLIGRFRKHSKLELEIVAVAESDSLTRSCGIESDDYADYSGCIRFKIFDTPNCIKGKSIKMKPYRPKQFGAEVAFDMSSIALFVNLLSLRSSGEGVQKWCWKPGKMSLMREVMFSEIRTHESRPSKRKLATEAPADIPRQPKRKRTKRKRAF